MQSLRIGFLSLVLTAAGATAAHAGPTAKTLTARPNQTVTVRGDISGGAKIALDWAASSQIACFPSIRNNQFDGNHVLYRTKLPPNSTMIIELAPRRP